jgi:hypothetical protein
LWAAHKYFETGPSIFGYSNLDFERLYAELYQDIRDHKDIWFNEIFPIADKYSERCVGILGTLATIRRQRGQVQDCLEILALDEKVLGVFASMVADSTDLRAHSCLEGLTYKFHLIQINAFLQVSDMKKAILAFRRTVSIELKGTLDPAISSNWGDCLPKFDKNYKTQLEDSSDDEIAFILDIYKRSSPTICGEDSAKPHLDVGLRPCANCQKPEQMRGDYQVCAACKTTPYCSPACQKAHWRSTHKATCAGKKKKTKK